MNEFWPDLLTCDRAPFGWRCTRSWHPHGTPCAAVPRWWNVRARLRGF